jgi:hypothetical protein
MNNELAGPNDIAWSPPGTSSSPSRTRGQDAALQGPGVRAGKSSSRCGPSCPEDAQGLQIALALAIGDLGEVYAGGIGAGNYPAVAYIGG